MEPLLYHGSKVKEEILRRGFDIEAPRVSDPGDFGWGIYLTSELSRAKAAAGKQNVLDVEVEFKNPLVLRAPYAINPPETPGDRFIAELRERFGDTVHGLTTEEAIELHRQGKSPDEIADIAFHSRVTASKKWAEAIQKAGYDAVVWEKPYYYGPIEENYEVVIFNPEQIKSVREHEYSGNPGGAMDEIRARQIAEEAAVKAAELTGSKIIQQVARELSGEVLHGNPISPHCEAVLAKPPICWDFRGIRSFVLCKAWAIMEEEKRMRLPVGEAWSEARRVCVR